MVAIHLPAWTSDPEIRTLIQRFKQVKRHSGDFATMKIRPTTPDDPKGRYQRMTLLIFSDPSWTEQDILYQYLTVSKENREHSGIIQDFESAVRGGYQITEDGKEKGWVGPIGQEEYIGQ